MADITVCGSCSAPVSPTDLSCPRCGSILPGDPVGGTAGIADGVAAAVVGVGQAAEGDSGAPSGAPSGVATIKREAAREAAARAAVAGAEAARQAAARAAAERMVARAAAEASDAENRIEPEAESEPVPGFEPANESPVAAVPAPALQSAESESEQAHYLAPSMSRTLGSIGGGRPDVAALRQAQTLPEPPSAPASIPSALAPPPAAPVPVATRLARPAPPVPELPATTWARMKVKLASISSEPKSELAATALVALGGAVATVSFFLPWAAQNGMAVGVMGSNPRPNAWAFDTPAGWPLFFVTAALMALVLGSDQLEELLPGVARVVRRLTETVAPMLLGGIYMGVAIVYRTVPWQTGSGLSFLALGAVLLVAGSIVGLFFPAGDRSA